MMLELHAMELYDVLAKFLPAGWERLALFGQVDGGAYEFTFYVRQKGSSQYQQCYAMARAGQFPRIKLLNAFDDLYEVCRTAKRELKEKEPGLREWTRFTFVIDQEGSFSVDYEYGDMIAGVPQAWKDRYLV